MGENRTRQEHGERDPSAEEKDMVGSSGSKRCGVALLLLLLLLLLFKEPRRPSGRQWEEKPRRQHLWRRNPSWSISCQAGHD